MILAKRHTKVNVRKMQRTSLNSSYSYSIFNMDMPFKICDRNLYLYSLHQNHKEIGVTLSNHSTLDKSNNDVLFNNKKALAQSFQQKIILNLKQPKNQEYNGWLKLIQKQCLRLNPSFIMLPINSDLDTSSIALCNKAIQEINSILFSFALDSEVVIYQNKENISSLSYIVNSIAFPTKTSLCLNIDNMLSPYHLLDDIYNDIVKFNILNKISMIETNAHSLKDKEFINFLSKLKDDVIVFGDKI